MSESHTPIRLPFRISVTLAFVLIAAPLLLGAIGILYVRSAQLARDLATETMNRATSEILNHIEVLFSPMVRAVEATATLGKIDPGLLRRPDALRFYFDVLESMPQADGFYVGGQDGSFYQAARLPPDLKLFGATGAKPPEGARFALRRIDASAGDQAGTVTFLAGWGEILAIERATVPYDPRTRPWFQAARESAPLSISDAYVFFSTGRPGVTIAQRTAADDGALIGVVGADISLATLSDFLAREQVGAHGVAVVIDNNGRLVGYRELSAIVQQQGNEVTLSRASEVGDDRVAQAVKRRATAAVDRFTLRVAGSTYLASFTPLPPRFGKDWTIGVIASEDDFVGPIWRMSLLVLALGIVVLLIGLAAILVVSKSLTDPIRRIVAETKRISGFELDGGQVIDSRVVEIYELARMLHAMKEGLRSFGAYIPKVLVRRIVASGKGTGIGGERRVLSILFTDVADFTRQSERQTPEDVLDQLSAYFTVMSRSIEEFGGTVDKFIGDGVMAFWNAPLDDANHALAACHAALRCRTVAAQLNAVFEAHGRTPMWTRFGLHTGEAVVGNVGSIDRMQYTAMGAEVNIAARVEGLNKHYGTQIIVTDAVEERARNAFVFRPLDVVVPSGTSRAIAVFELVGALGGGVDCASDSAVALCREWGSALEAYRRRDFAAALEQFSVFAERHPADVSARVYIERCTGFVAAPPPDNWDGVERYESK